MFRDQAASFLVPLTSLWWLVLVLGTAVPITHSLINGRGRRLARLDGKKAKEQRDARELAVVSAPC